MLFRGQAETYANLQPTLARATQGGAHDAAALLERRLIGNTPDALSRPQDVAC